jgi:hypothetical protein
MDPSEAALERLADGLDVEFRGRLAPADALRVAQNAGAFVLRAWRRRSASPTSRRWRRACRRSGTRGEPGPEEIAASGGGMTLVDAGDFDGLGRRRSGR